MPTSEVERDLTRLEAELKRLEAEDNMFFPGRFPKPSRVTRRSAGSLVRRYARAYIQNTGDRFRFSTLQSRFAAFVDLWDRGMRAREEGRPGPFAQKSIEKAIQDMTEEERKWELRRPRHDHTKIPKDEKLRLMQELESQMAIAAENLEFEKAADLRDEVDLLRRELGMFR